MQCLLHSKFSTTECMEVLMQLLEGKVFFCFYPAVMAWFVGASTFSFSRLLSSVSVGSNPGVGNDEYYE